METASPSVLRQGTENLQLAFGEFALEGDYRLLSTHVDIAMAGGRYRRDASELRLWLPDNFLEANRNGFILTLLVAAVTVYLILENRRKRRELARPAPSLRPQRPL